jgi:hypothetical protein
VSRAAVANPGRRRELRPVEIPPHVAALLEPGSEAYRFGGCRVIVSQQAAGWHLSISRPDRLPSWEEIRDARYALVPDEATMALLLPPRSEYVNVHEFCMQLYEIPGEYIAEHQDRLLSSSGTIHP